MPPKADDSERYAPLKWAEEAIANVGGGVQRNEDSVRDIWQAIEKMRADMSDLKESRSWLQGSMGMAVFVFTALCSLIGAAAGVAAVVFRH